jgi:hypothetical protein
MDAATAATLFLTLVWPNGAETSRALQFPTVAECEAHASRVTSAPQREGRPYTRSAECHPHYRNDALTRGD